MADINQLELLQERIGREPVMPDALDRYRALKMLEKKPIRKKGGGQPDVTDEVKEIASKGRYGDTMLMHVNPKEVRGLDSLGKMTYNPETGLPEAWLWALPLAGAAIGGIGAAATGHDWKRGALMGGALGLGGMGLAGPAASGLAGIGGIGSAGALPGLWSGLGPIGQGMVTGGAMGGISGLFGKSESPLRDILVGAAMGGVGGALFGGGTGASSTSGGGTGGALSVEPPSGTFVPVTSPGAPPPVIRSSAFSRAAADLNPQAALSPSSVRPVSLAKPSYIAQHGTGTFGAPYAPSGQAYVRPPIDLKTDLSAAAKGTSKATASDAAAPKAAADTTPKVDTADKNWFGGLKDWWKDREWYEKAGLGLGAGVLAQQLLKGSGEQQELEKPKPIQPFEKGDPKTPLKPISPLTEEQIRTAYTGPSGTGIDTWFQPAKEGGLTKLAAGGVFEGRVQGKGDGMADQVAFNVRPQTPADIPNTPDVALLSSDEYVVPADVVSMLGNGSSTAGAKSLDKFNQLMRRKAHGTNKQQTEINAEKELSSLA